MAWLGVIAYFTLTPQPFLIRLQGTSEPLELAQALAEHFLIFGVLTGLFLLAAIRQAPPRPTHLVFGVVVLVGVAALDEWAQRLVPNRSPSWLDLAANSAGILSFAALWWGRRRGHSSDRPGPDSNGR